MNRHILKAAKAVVDHFKEAEQQRGEIPDTFIDPVTKKQLPNATTIHVTKLRALAAAVQDPTPDFTVDEVTLLKKMVADRLSNIAAHLRSLESSASHESESTRFQPRATQLHTLRDKLNAMQG